MNREVVEAFTQLAKEKKIEKDKIAFILEDVFKTLMRKKYGENAEFDIIVNMERGDIEIFLIKDIVDVVRDPVREVSLEKAKESDPTLELGEKFAERIEVKDFGLRLISQAKHLFIQRLSEYERDSIMREYESYKGEILIGEVYQVYMGKDGKPELVLLMHNKNEMILPRSEMIPDERYRKNESLRVLVKEVKPPSFKDERRGAGPQIIVSRADPQFLVKLFELEIPEVYDGIVIIESVARIPGKKSKIAVASTDERVDPVGACVGMKGVRIHSIVKELNNENIDVIAYSADPAIYVARALQPAKPKGVEIDPKEKRAIVYVPPEEVATAIGDEGINVKLASMLTGYNIEVISTEGEKKDVQKIIRLSDLKDQIGEEIYQRLKDAGIETNRDYLALSDENIKSILSGLQGVDERKIKRLRNIIRKASR
ncbi:MAG: transcription termination factor NusA [Candidatus Kryptonium sp.]|nr:transcription termination factor NusA [Candidatus Kryptonium sp.]MCX7762901.1 transcription termination factor NusA [Candidatus Kryptonium sp.]MDW8109431.1 transcription termination factor NusA [Candidatus Kryptonium sp.]